MNGYLNSIIARSTAAIGGAPAPSQSDSAIQPRPIAMFEAPRAVSDAGLGEADSAPEPSDEATPPEVRIEREESSLSRRRQQPPPASITDDGPPEYPNKIGADGTTPLGLTTPETIAIPRRAAVEGREPFASYALDAMVPPTRSASAGPPATIEPGFAVGASPPVFDPIIAEHEARQPQMASLSAPAMGPGEATGSQDFGLRPDRGQFRSLRATVSSRRAEAARVSATPLIDRRAFGPTPAAIDGPASSEEPVIHVTIGRVDIRAVPIPAAAAKPPRPPAGMTLDEYLGRSVRRGPGHDR